MDRKEKRQKRSMKWVLFWIFVTIFVIVSGLTIAKIFFDFGKPTEVERNRLFYVFIGQVGTTVLMICKALFGLKKKPAKEDETELPSVNGKYKYEITSCDGKMRFLGDCRIKQEGRELTVNGIQKKSQVKRKKEKVSIHWNSQWAELCQDNKLRLDYYLSLNGGFRGYAILELGRASSKEMFGEFHLMGHEYIGGTVHFKKA